MSCRPMMKPLIVNGNRLGVPATTTYDDKPTTIRPEVGGAASARAVRVLVNESSMAQERSYIGLTTQELHHRRMLQPDRNQTPLEHGKNSPARVSERRNDTNQELSKCASNRAYGISSQDLRRC